MYLDVSPYKEILAGMEAALGINEGIIKLTGAQGTGKTALGYQLSTTLQQKGQQVVFFLNAPRNPDELQTGILRQLHLQEKGSFTRRLTDYLLSLPAENRVLHVLIDNAQQMNELTFNAVRMLCNIQDDTQSLVRVVLLASPAINHMMSSAGLRSFAQHMSHSFQLHPMHDEQVKNFCWAWWREKHLEHAPPEDGWINELLKLSGGLPGAVLAELGDEEHSNEINITARIEQVVVEERKALEQDAAPVSEKRGARMPALLLILLMIAAAGYTGYRYLEQPQAPVATSPAAPIPAATPVTTPPVAASPATTPTATPPAQPANTTIPAAPPTPAITAITATNDEPILDPEVEQSIIAEAEVVRLLNAWVENWQVQNLPGYFANYGAGFVPESLPSRDAWERERRRIISAARDVSIGWRELQIRARDEQSIVAEIWLDYSSSTYSDRTLKELTLGFEDGRAVILRERNLTVQP